MFNKDAELANFADDNIIYAATNSIEKHIKVLGKESKSAIDWLKINDMIVNPDRLKAIILSYNKKGEQT